MSLSPGVKDRLLNFKFSTALANQKTEQATEDELELLTALAHTFGNTGWMEGHIGVIVDGAITYLIKDSSTHE